MRITDYNPRPMSVDTVELPSELIEALEMLAQNTHEVWARGRLDEGWTYSEILNAELKTHPSLVPYAELPESEKDYDRRTSSQVIKALLKMGFEIIPPLAVPDGEGPND